MQNMVAETSVPPPDFPEPKSTGVYTIPTLGLDEGPFIFTYLSLFLSYITPHDLPVVNCVLELLRDAFHARVSLVELIMEALKIESGFICLIALFCIISIIPLGIVIGWGCITNGFVYTVASTNGLNTGNDDSRMPSVDSSVSLEESMSNATHCRRRVLQFLLQILIIFLIASIAAMVVTNQQIATAIDKSPEVIRASLKDVEAYLKDMHQQISFSVHEGVNTATERIKYDIEDMDKLLGQPIQKELEFDTANSEIIHRIQLMHDSIVKAILISQDAIMRVEELQVQLAVMQRQCTGRDRPLCDTLLLKGFEENNILEILIRLQTDPALYKMLTLGEQDVDGVPRNLTTELTAARQAFHGLSGQIKENGTKYWIEIQDHLITMKQSMNVSTKILSSTIASLVDSIDKTWTVALPFLDDLDEVGYTVWALALSIAITILLITMVLMGGLSYGCFQFEGRAGTIFIIGATAMSLGSVGLALFTVFAMLLGGHGEVFLCRSMYDSPEFIVLGKLLDRPGLLFPNASGYGVIGDMFRPAGSNRTISNATLANAIRECETNGASYEVFQLERLMNVSRIVDIYEYPQLIDAIEKISVSANHFSTLTEPLQKIFDDMYTNTNIDLSGYRMELNQAVPERDIATFIDQLQRVSMHIQDVATSSRMNTLSNRARRLQTSVFEPLEKMRNEIVFHLTALELQRQPWINQVNHSLVQLKSTQFFLSRDAESVFIAKAKLFKDRIKKHLITNRIHLMTLLNERIASCRPLFDIFDANRSLLCRHTMDPLNGLWFSGLMCLILWTLATPLVLDLANIYRRMNCVRGLRHTNSHQAPTDSLIISEQSNWAAPSSQRTSANIDRSNW